MRRTITKKPARTLSAEQAQRIIDAHDIMSVMESKEEMDLLEAHNPELFDAYTTLLYIANQ